MKTFPLQLLLLVQNVAFTKGSSFRRDSVLWYSSAEIVASEMSKPKVNDYFMNASFPAGALKATSEFDNGLYRHAKLQYVH